VKDISVIQLLKSEMDIRFHKVYPYFTGSLLWFTDCACDGLGIFCD